MSIDTYNTKYGLVSLFSNEVYISYPFKHNEYWDEDTLLKLKQFINPSKNILEIGSHCGTSSLVYSSFLCSYSKLYAFEPQKNLYSLLNKNIIDNNLQNKIIPFNKALFCFSGIGNMNDIDIDGGNGVVQLRYTTESHLPCNYGGICLGTDGETVEFITVDEIYNLGIIDNIGFIHLDAQGSEPFILSKATKLIEKYRPVIYYENNRKYDKKLYDKVSNSYPQYKEESEFDIEKFCFEKLKYSKKIERFNGGLDDLLLP